MRQIIFFLLFCFSADFRPFFASTPESSHATEDLDLDDLVAREEEEEEEEEELVQMEEGEEAEDERKEGYEVQEEEEKKEEEEKEEEEEGIETARERKDLGLEDEVSDQEFDPGHFADVEEENEEDEENEELSGAGLSWPEAVETAKATGACRACGTKSANYSQDGGSRLTTSSSMTLETRRGRGGGGSDCRSGGSNGGDGDKEGRKQTTEDRGVRSSAFPSGMKTHDFCFWR